MDHVAILRSVEAFKGISEGDLNALADICEERTYQKDEIITRQGEEGDELYIVCDGFLEVVHSPVDEDAPPRTVVNLGEGQIAGEMALVDGGPRSATVRASSEETVVLVIRRNDFETLCEKNHFLGYVIMRNIAADLSFKVRHQHLAGR